MSTPSTQTTVNFRGRKGIAKGFEQEVEKPKNAGIAIKRLFKYLGREKLALVSLLGAVVFVTVTSLMAPSLQGRGIDIILGKDWDSLMPLVIMLLIVYGINVLFTLVQSLLSAKLSQRIVRRMRYDLFEKIDNLSIPYLDSHSSGDVMSRMTNDVENISTTISQSLGSLFSGVMTLIGTVAVMFYYCWQLTLITMFTCILTVVVTKILSTLMRKAFKQRSIMLGRLNGHSEEMITGYKTIVAYNQQEDVRNEFNEASDQLTKVSIRAEILSGCMGPCMNAINNISFIIVAAFGGYFALTGLISVGVISAFIIYAKQFSRPINEIAQLYGTLQTAIACSERVFDLMDEPGEDNSGDKKLDKVLGRIEFKNVDFSYVEGHKVLDGFNLSINPGEKIALVGATGSGKTTVVNLLMRYYMPDSGEIILDGENIQDIQRDFLRNNMAIVLQDTVLFSDTIENNIRYSVPDASVDKVIDAAKMSNCHEFINRLPDKYKTYLVQAGSTLSQGQRQLLTIARAVVADPRVLILDEATSSVDTRTEKKIQDAMVRLMKNRTSVIIAHRLSTIQDSDKIVVMDQGRIVEIGKHDELLEKKGYYYRLYMTQFEGKVI